MREYKFALNSVEINDEPIGWNESKRKLVRSSSFKGLFVEYINDITFHGDGYDAIMSEINTNGFCSEIHIDIYYRCSEFDSFSLYFRGKIRMADIEIDVLKCTINCNIEDNTIDAIIENLKDTPVRFDAAKTISGETLTSISNTITIRDTLVFATTVNRTAYRVYDAFQYILSYISDNQITFVSDYFSTDTSDRGQSSISFSNPGVDLVGAGNVVIVYKNAFNVQTTLTIPKQGTVASTLNYIISQFNFNNSGTVESKFYTQDYKYYNHVTTNGTDTITLLYDIPGFEIISVSVASTIVNDTNISNGMKNLALTTGNQLRNTNTQVPVITFKELFEEMDRFHDLGMSITIISGVVTLRIEPYIYFFDNQTYGNGLNLPNVLGLKRRSSKDFAKDLITVGDGNDNKGNVGKQSSKIDWIVSTQCSDVKINLNNKYISDSAECYEQLTFADDTKDDKIFLFECESGSLSTIRYHNIIYSSTAAAYVDYYAYNAHLTNFWKIRNWFFNLKGDAVHEQYTMTNDCRIKILNEYEFEYPLTSDQQEQLISERTLDISFDDGNTFYSGFAKEIIMQNKSGLSSFKLLST